MCFPEYECADPCRAPGVHHMEATRVGNLSLGEQRYLQFLLVIHLNHPFVLLDEPFSMVEPMYREIIKEKIRELQRIKAFIITDHYYKDVLDIATKKLLMESGKISLINDEHDLATGGYLPAKQHGNRQNPNNIHPLPELHSPGGLYSAAHQ